MNEFVVLCRFSINKHFGPPYCRAEMCGGRVAAAPWCQGEYADGTDRQTDRRTDGGQTVKLCLPQDSAYHRNDVT